MNHSIAEIGMLKICNKKIDKHGNETENKYETPSDSLEYFRLLPPSICWRIFIRRRASDRGNMEQPADINFMGEWGKL